MHGFMPVNTVSAPSREPLPWELGGWEGEFRERNADYPPDRLEVTALISRIATKGSTVPRGSGPGVKEDRERLFISSHVIKSLLPK